SVLRALRGFGKKRWKKVASFVTVFSTIALIFAALRSYGFLLPKGDPFADIAGVVRLFLGPEGLIVAILGALATYAAWPRMTRRQARQDMPDGLEEIADILGPNGGGDDGIRDRDDSGDEEQDDQDDDEPKSIEERLNDPSLARHGRIRPSETSE